MSKLSQDPNWSSISGLRPKLRRHIRIYPQEYRGERWYILHDQSSGRHLRFNVGAYSFIGRLTGKASVQEICEQLASGPDNTPLTRDDASVILTQLFAIDALGGNLSGEAEVFFKRYQNTMRLRRIKALMNPLAIRIKLIDPDQFLNRLTPWVRPLFSVTGVFLWLFVIVSAGLLALAHFSDLRDALSTDVLAPANLLSMVAVYVLIKLVHEFAHAFAVKVWGGEVHEMGITLLLFFPIPYVDASAAWGFSDKYKRVLVGAVGILAELFVAALALFLWLVVEPGAISDMALNAVLVGSVSTLLFNANPLLKFDAYYMLQDLIEIPNLYSRSSRFYLYLLQRYLFGLDRARSPVTATGEGIWFVVYGFVALLYRLLILATIVLFLSQEYLFAGVALGCWAVLMQLVSPLGRGLRFLFFGAALGENRFRAISVSLLIVGSLCSVMAFVPLSLTTRAEGVVWVSDQAQIYAGTEGFVEQLLVASGTPVKAGTPLIQIRDPSLRMAITKLEAKRRELEIRAASEYLEKRVQSAITEEELASVEAELLLLRQKQSELLVHSDVGGVFVLLDERSMLGRYLQQGELVGYIVSPERLIIRTVIPQSDIGLFRQHVEMVQVRLAERAGIALPARIIRETPAGSRVLPSRALGAAGGGEIAVSAAGDQGLTAAEKVFQIDLGLPDDLDIAGLGERAYIRFDHGSEPLASQWLRTGRQLVLSRLSF